jgi:hypothetical protein
MVFVEKSLSSEVVATQPNDLMMRGKRRPRCLWNGRAFSRRNDFVVGLRPLKTEDRSFRRIMTASFFLEHFDGFRGKLRFTRYQKTTTSTHG